MVRERAAENLVRSREIAQEVLDLLDGVAVSFLDMVFGVPPRCRSSVKLITIVLALNVFLSVAAQSHLKRLPTFEDYPVRKVFSGTPHPPILVTAEQRRFRTMIREGVEKGWGVWINGEWGKEQHRPGPNFAGHYVVIVWGCGAPCLRMAVCDAETGEVYDPSLSAASGFALPLLVFGNSPGGDAEMEYRLDSRLMIIRATPRWWEQPDAKPYSFYFLFEDKQWRLLRRAPIADEE